MKIIFDSEEEKREFFLHSCPSEYGLKDAKSCKSVSHCFECWEKSGLGDGITVERHPILEVRCERYRDFITSTEDWYERAIVRYNAGKLSPNDLRYLMGKKEI